MIKPATIWKRASETREARAEFLWNMYRSYSRRDERVLTRTYLDIGTGDLVNARIFRQRSGSKDAVAIDIRSDIAKSQEIAFVRADATALPFRDRSFDLVTMISLVEHVQDPSICITEALRALKKNGELFIQLPNRYFPVEIHSGLCMYFYFPKRVRNCLADVLGREYMKEVDTPAVWKIRKTLRSLKTDREIVTVGFWYPQSLLPDCRLVRVFSRVINTFRILPIGYVVLVHGSCFLLAADEQGA
jgi:SAM-dependent methyltransferase